VSAAPAAFLLDSRLERRGCASAAPPALVLTAWRGSSSVSSTTPPTRQQCRLSHQGAGQARDVARPQRHTALPPGAGRPRAQPARLAGRAPRMKSSSSSPKPALTVRLPLLCSHYMACGNLSGPYCKPLQGLPGGSFADQARGVLVSAIVLSGVGTCATLRVAHMGYPMHRLPDGMWSHRSAVRGLPCKSEHLTHRRPPLLTSCMT